MNHTGVEIRGLRKRFGRLEVLRGLDLDLAAGRITAILGPNAAGKTTLIKAMLGLVRPGPRGGSVRIDGVMVNGDPGYRQHIGYMPQAAQFPEQLTGREILALIVDLRQSPTPPDLELIERFGLERSLDKPVRALSGGTRQKLNAAVAFLFRPSLLILDEPTAGLDPLASRVLKDKVLHAAKTGTTVVLTSHIMSEVAELAEDLVFLSEGQAVYQGAVATLLGESGEATLERAVARLLETNPR